jgi:hypothetical protein
MLQRVTPDPATLIDITNCANAIEAELLAQFLTEHGVYAHAATLAGSTNPWELGSSIPFRIAVRREDVDRGNELVREFRSRKQEPVKVDWDEVDVGEPEEGVVLPPAAESKHRHYRWRWLRRIGLLAIVCTTLLWSGILAAIIFLFVVVIEFAVVIAGKNSEEA